MPERTKAIALAGLRGSGKSTLGPLLARELGRPFVDLDDVTADTLREAHGLPPDATISEMFASLGEPAFREAEVASLKGLLAAGDLGLVIALGGGTPTAPGAEKLIRDAQSEERLVLLYLRWSPFTLAARLKEGDQRNRPALVGKDPSTEVPAVFMARDPLYREMADHVIDLDGMNTQQALAAVRGLV